MGLRINTNSQSLSAQRALGVNSAAQKAAFEHVSSGSRIYRAADDAAGLAISEKMRAGIRSIRQDMRNANDAIGMIQTAEGGMNEISNILVRFRELSTQAASDTLSESERAFIDKEVQALGGEVNRIAKGTEFNNHKLLNGEGKMMEFQIGLHNNAELDRIDYDHAKANVTMAALGLEGMTVADKESAQANLDKVDTALNALSSSRADLGALQNRLQSTINGLQVYDENLSTARSRIADVDMAAETAEITKGNILVQAGTSVLSQANQNPMLALKLLG
jgi:flagellin